jgi:hypothetical protein
LQEGGAIRTPYDVLDYDPDEKWAERANCKNKVFELFEYQDADSPATAGMKSKDRLEYNYNNFQRAAEICIECPVFFQCGTNATDDDKYWTVRQGEVPGRFLAEKVDYEKMKARGGSVGTLVCARGHEKPAGKRCPTCKKATNDRYLARLQALNDRLAADKV